MNEAAPSRLRWRCRRGMRELDQLLARYLEHGWPQASQAERDAFDALLDTEDDVLWDWCLGHGRPADPALDAALQAMRSLAPR